MDAPIEITGRLLTRNWILNLAGQALPLFLALGTIPYVIRGLGAERFGVLSIAWVLLNYLSLFDLGLGRATTKFLAECLGRGEHHRVSSLVWTSLWAQALLGIVGTALAAAATPFLVDHVLKLTPALRAETSLTFFMLAASLPVVLCGNTLRGVLEAGQHFEVVNYVRIPANASVFLLPAVGVLFGFHVPGIVFLLVLSRAAASVAYLLYCFRLFPTIRNGSAWDRALVGPMLGYGGWITISNVVGPFLTYVDRFLIGSMISMTAVGYYTAPYEAITRVWALPSSLTSTIFPAFSSLDASGSKRKLEELCARSLKSLILSLGPLLFLAIYFAREILRVWLGPDFAAKGAPVLQLLAVGVLINSLAFVPSGLLQGVGRPDLVAKIHLIELPFYVVALVFFLKHMGIAGAALAWTLRVSVDAILIFGTIPFLQTVSLRRIFGNRVWRTAFAVCCFGALLELPRLAEESLRLRGIFAALLLLAFAATTWKYLFDSSDRHLVVSAAGYLRSPFERAK